MTESNEGLNRSEATSTQKASWREKVGSLFRRKPSSVVPPTSQEYTTNPTEDRITLLGVQDAVFTETRDVADAAASYLEAVPSNLRQEYEGRKEEVEALYSGATYWHGTGRKQYRNGEVVDILERIIDQGGLSLQRDPFDTKIGVAQTISLSDRRMYSAGYAKMHLFKGASLGFEYMSGEFWGIFLRNTIREAIGRTKLEGAIKAGKVLWEHLREGKNPAYLLNIAKSARSWTSKVTKEEYKKPMDKVFTARSDIPGNYPILIGVRGHAFTPTQTAKFISLYEVRANTPIPFSGFTHIEVPKAHVGETEQLLTQRGVTTLPVIPMELGEIYSSQFSPQQLIDGNPVKK